MTKFGSNCEKWYCVSAMAPRYPLTWRHLVISILPFLIYNANISGSSNVKDRKFILDTVGREEILGESECYDIEYDLSVLDAMLGPSHWDELTKEGKLSHARLVKMQSKIKALKAHVEERGLDQFSYKKDSPMKTAEPRGRVLRDGPMHDQKQLNILLDDLSKLFRRLYVSVNRIKSRKERLLSLMRNDLVKEVHGIMSSTQRSVSNTEGLIHGTHDHLHSMYRDRVRCQKVYGNYSCPVPVIKQDYIQVLTWAWQHARMDKVYRSAQESFSRVIDMARLSRDQEIKHVTIQHDLLLHKTKSKIREHYRRVRRINKKLKKIANLINRLDDRRRIIKRSYSHINRVLEDQQYLRNTSWNAFLGVQETRSTIKRIYGPIIERLRQLRPLLHSMRWDYLEDKKRYRYEILARIQRQTVFLVDDVRYKFEPLRKPLTRASPYTELLQSQKNISRLVLNMDDGLRAANQKIEYFTSLVIAMTKHATSGKVPVPKPNQEYLVDGSGEETMNDGWWDWGKGDNTGTTTVSKPVTAEKDLKTSQSLSTVMGIEKSSTSQTTKSNLFTKRSPTAEAEHISTAKNPIAVVAAKPKCVPSWWNSYTCDDELESTNVPTTLSTKKPTTEEVITLSTMHPTIKTTPSVPTTIPSTTTTMTVEATKTTLPNESISESTTSLPTSKPKCVPSWWNSYKCDDELESTNVPTALSTKKPTTISTTEEVITLSTMHPTIKTTPSTMHPTIKTTTSVPTTIPSKTKMTVEATKTTLPNESISESTTSLPTSKPKCVPSWWNSYKCDDELESTNFPTTLSTKKPTTISTTEEVITLSTMHPTIKTTPSTMHPTIKTTTSVPTTIPSTTTKMTVESTKTTLPNKTISESTTSLPTSKPKCVPSWWNSYKCDDELESTDVPTTKYSEITMTSVTSEEVIAPSPIPTTIKPTPTVITSVLSTTAIPKEGMKSTDMLPSTSKDRPLVESTVTTDPSTTQELTTTSSLPSTIRTTVIEVCYWWGCRQETVEVTPSADTSTLESSVKLGTPGSTRIPSVEVTNEQVSSTSTTLTEEGFGEVDGAKEIDCEAEEEGSGEIDPLICPPRIKGPLDAAKYLRDTIHSAQGKGFKLKFDAGYVQQQVYETKGRYMKARHKLHRELSDFPQNEGEEVKGALKEQGLNQLNHKRLNNFNFKIDFIGDKNNFLHDRILSFEKKLNETRSNMAFVENFRRNYHPPLAKVKETRSYFRKIVDLDHGIALKLRNIEHLKDSIEWNLEAMKRQAKYAKDTERDIMPVIPLNDNVPLNGILPSDLRQPKTLKQFGFTMKTNSLTGTLLQLGSVEEKVPNDNRIDVGVREGKPCAVWMVKGIKKMVTCPHTINDGKWHHLKITRSGNELVLNEHPQDDPFKMNRQSITLPIDSIFAPLAKDIHLNPQKLARNRPRRDVHDIMTANFTACLTNFNMDGHPIVLVANTSIPDLQACTYMPATLPNESLSMGTENEVVADRDCIPRRKIVFNLAEFQTNITMISVSFKTKQKKGALLVYRTTTDDIWVLRFFRGYIMFEGKIRGERFLKICYQRLASRHDWNLFVITMNDLTSLLYLNGKVCLETRMRLLQLPPEGDVSLTVYATRRDLRNVAPRVLPSRTRVRPYHGRLRHLMVNNRKLPINQEDACGGNG